MKGLLRSRWALLVLILVIVKSALVLSLSDIFFYGEELEKGVAAKAMIDGLDVPHHQLAYHYYEGGGFVISHCAAVAFMLVGQNLLAHKLVALSFQVASLLAGCFLTRRLFGRKAAVWFGLLFIFGPESYQKLSMISLGIHYEACLFLFLVMLLGGKLLFERENRVRYWFLLGLVTGMGLYFSYQVALAAVWVALLLILYRRRELLGVRGVAGVLGTALGALPLIVMYSLVGDAVFDIHGTSIAKTAEGPTNSVLFREFLASIFIDGDLGERLTPVAWTISFFAACGFLLWRAEPLLQPREHSRKHATLYVLGYMVLFWIVYLFSGFVQGRAYHFSLVLRLVPLYAFGAVLIAASLGELSASELIGSRKLSFVLGALLIALGVRATISVLRTGRPFELAQNWSILTHQKGYSYDQYFAKVLPHFDGNREDKLRLIEGFDDPARELLRADAVKNLYGEELLSEHGGEVLLAWSAARTEVANVAADDAERLAQYELGLGGLVIIGHGWSWDAALELGADLPPELRSATFEALGRFGGPGYPLPAAIDREVSRCSQIEGSQMYLRGIGRWAYTLHRRAPQGFEEVLEVYPGEVSGSMRQGFEAEWALNLLEK
ncbi:MAG: hypothetical protein ACI8X5_002840 [Planctomycetota bacterium]|jgi:hypothetical protein